MGAHPLILRANSPAKWNYLCLPLDLSEFNCEHIELWICPSLTVDFICHMILVVYVAEGHAFKIFMFNFMTGICLQGKSFMSI